VAPRATGPLGRAVRLLAGAIGLSFIATQRLAVAPAEQLLLGGVWILALLAAYSAAVLLLTRLRVPPWPASTLLLAPLLAYPLGIGPAEFHLAQSVYLELSLVVAAVVGYRGAEVAVLPDLLRRARLDSRTPANVVDAMEDELRHTTAPLLARVAAGVAVLAMALFWTVPTLRLPGPVGDAVSALSDTRPVWSVALLVAGLLFWLALRRRGLPLAALLVVTAGLSAIGLLPDALWGLVVVAGLVVALGGLRRLRT